MKTPIVFRVYKKEQIFVVKQFVDDDRIVIGNGPDVHIDLGSDISPIHCIVEKRGDGFFICDMGSDKGTFRDKRLVLDERISNGDAFQIGPYSIVFFIGSQKNIASNTTPLPEDLPPGPLSPQDRPVAPAAIAPAPVMPVAAAKPAAVKPAYVPPVKPKAAILSAKARRKARNTFAPKSDYKDLKDHLKVGTGNYVEVIVSWQERIVETYHFPVHGKKLLGVNGDISVPEGSAPKDWQLLSLDSVVTVHTTSEMKVEVLRDGEIRVIKDSEYKLQQAEACFIRLINGMQLVIRFAPKPPVMLFESPLVLGASEFTGLLASLIIAVLAGLLVSVSKPKNEKTDEQLQIVAKVIFTNPPKVPLVEIVDAAPPEVKSLQPEVVKKVESKEQKVDPAKVAKTKASDAAGKAAEVKPKDSKLKAKMFTSTKQGGAIKTGPTDGANAKSKEPDPNNSGLLAAFGSGGARSKLDQVYSGSGELLGAGEKAKGASGFSANRAGDDLGSKFKDTGAGGAGTATQGIAGIGTKGRSTGMTGYGSGTGFGDKDKVQISAGGSEESFVGSIDKEAVRRVIMAALSQFKSCYEREYRQNTKLEGKVVVAWEIHEQGMPKNARIVMEKSNIKNKLVEECVKTRMLGLRFPEPPAGTWADISFPFVFHGQKF